MDDTSEGLDVVVLEVEVDPEASSQGSSQQTTTCRRSHEGEGIEIDLDGASARPLIQHDVDAVVFHSRVEVFLYDRAQTMYFVDEEDIIGLEGGEQACQVSRLV